MRISTQTFYAQSMAAMSSQQSSLSQVQAKLASSSQMVSPSDDPVGAANALTVSQAISLNGQYAASNTQATQSLSMESNALQSISTLLISVKSLVIEAGDGALSDADRGSIAIQLQSDYTQLQGLGNSQDGNGQYLFAGFVSGNAPFTQQANGSMSYNGDQGQRMMQVSASQQISASDAGGTIFQSVQRGAGYVTSAASGNSGSAAFGQTAMANASDPNYGQDFVVSFTGGNYSVVTTTAPNTLIASGTYTAGTPISFGGVTLSVTGTPANGDSLNVTTAKNAGTDMFGAISDIITALQQPVSNGTPAALAQLQNALTTGNVKITNALNNVTTVNASAGSRLNELSTLSTAGTTSSLAYQTTLSNLQDVDYASTIAQFYQAQTALQASQQIFVKMQGISLMNYVQGR